MVTTGGSCPCGIPFGPELAEIPAGVVICDCCRRAVSTLVERLTCSWCDIRCCRDCCQHNGIDGPGDWWVTCWACEAELLASGDR
jgi:hypothetical protein